MSEFERRKRYLRYHDSDCTIFLRKDFDHKCAYCLTREADIGNPKDFQKDHFVPQKGGVTGKVHTKYHGETFDVHSYYNLYFCCSRCNGKSGRSNTWSPSLLDPCLDKIWDKHIKNNENLVEALTLQGEEYITTFQLNSKAARRFREKIRIQNGEILEHINELEKLKSHAHGCVAILDLIEKEIEKEKSKLKYGVKYIPNDYYYNDKEILEAEAILKKYNLNYLNGDYDLDYEIVFKKNNYQIYLRTQEGIDFTKGEKVFYLPIQQVKDWEDKKVLICRYDAENKKLYYIDFNEYLSRHQIVTGQKYMYVLKEKQIL